ncbi:hypothetical protein EAH57_15240 [Acinetobacter sp. 2JN-4]|uniref:hypothetical protein n=1 Tax=Acinetobacter sp. 2JN-4 TaxID=2479844 RepID=UPI000EF9F95B|nr:hypothetical protein [Acinetobacter sp. 2JN-4]RLZ06720.1 hypothetical protein EAH57_15240 [Acinetobacter sp. 2JN-4]
MRSIASQGTSARCAAMLRIEKNKTNLKHRVKDLSYEAFKASQEDLAPYLAHMLRMGIKALDICSTLKMG